MFKTTALALLAGIITATTIVPSHALFIAAPPNYPQKHAQTEEDCAYQLNYMPRVTRAHIDAIEDRHVYLIPVCEDGLIGRNDDYGWLFTSGNVGTLRQPIARNATLMNALTAQGYDQQDVVSLRFGGDGSIALYVHQRNLR